MNDTGYKASTWSLATRGKCSVCTQIVDGRLVTVEKDGKVGLVCSDCVRGAVDLLLAEYCRPAETPTDAHTGA